VERWRFGTNGTSGERRLSSTDQVEILEQQEDVMLILAALDRSDRDRLVLEQVRRLTAGALSQVCLLHAVSLPKSLVPGTVREAEAYLEAVRIELLEIGLEASVNVVKGDAAPEICREAEASEVDVVVLGTRGRTGWDRFALGSVAEQVLEHCTRPVLVVNESTINAKVDDEVRRRSAYIAAVIWGKQARGEISAQQAERDIARLGETGLNRAVMRASYGALESAGIPPDWLDVRFAVETLAQHLPSEVAGMGLPALREAPAA
jgi:nucleotide-binding universal stress UspA family protein